jgi:hypothetical protein
MTTPIPGPPGWPIIGNLRDVDINDTVRCFGDLAKTYGKTKTNKRYLYIYIPGDTN